jgi:hypothetical protein
MDSLFSEILSKIESNCTEGSATPRATPAQHAASTPNYRTVNTGAVSDEDKSCEADREPKDDKPEDDHSIITEDEDQRHGTCRFSALRSRAAARPAAPISGHRQYGQSPITPTAGTQLGSRQSATVEHHESQDAWAWERQAPNRLLAQPSHQGGQGRCDELYWPSLGEPTERTWVSIIKPHELDKGWDPVLQELGRQLLNVQLWVPEQSPQPVEMAPAHSSRLNQVREPPVPSQRCESLAF